MKNVKNSDRLREILVSTRHQIVALQDIKIEMISINSAIAKNIEQQIDALEEVYKHQLTIVNATQEIEPKRRGWFTGNIKTKEDRLANIMD